MDGDLTGWLIVLGIAVVVYVVMAVIELSKRDW